LVNKAIANTKLMEKLPIIQLDDLEPNYELGGWFVTCLAGCIFAYILAFFWCN